MDVRTTLLDAIDKPYIGVLKIIFKQMNKENNIWYSNKGNHLEITDRLGISQPTLEKHIRVLKDKRILIHKDTDGRGVYSVNREMIGYHG